MTATLRDTLDGISFDGDPYKFGETLHRMVASANDKKIPLFLPIGEDSLALFQKKAERMHEVLANAAPWSEDLKKDKAKL